MLRRSRLFPLAALALLIPLLAAPLYGKSLAMSRSMNGYNVNVALSQNPPIMGKNDVRVEINDAGGKRVTDADVTVNYFMPPMPGMAPMNYTVKALPRSSGYDATMNIIMKGPWNVAIRAGVGGKQLRMTILIDVR